MALPTMREILTVAANNQASDIHLTVGAPTSIRINGELKKGWQDMGTYEGDDYINGGAPFAMYGYAGDDYKMYVNGEYTIGGIKYTFAEDGTTMHGQTDAASASDDGKTEA